MTGVKHPATFSEELFPVFMSIIDKYKIKSILDPFAGIGKIGKLKEFGYCGTIFANEIEPEWIFDNKYNCDYTFCEDAETLKIPATVDAIITSPTYGNRMADHHNAKDGSKRITYTHYLGRNLNEENTGKMQYGDRYKEKHIRIYKNLESIIAPDGYFIINISNHIRNGKEVDVVNFHRDTILQMGFVQLEDYEIQTKRMKYGKNRNARVNCGHIIVFRRTPP